MARPISIDNAEHYNWGHKSDNCHGWHLVKSAALSVIQERVPSGACEQSHKHEFAEQFFFVLSGQATVIVEAETHILNPQQGVIPKPPQDAEFSVSQVLNIKALLCKNGCPF